MRGLDHVVLHVRPESVLRAEDRRQCQVVGRCQPIDDVDEAAIERGVVADDADASAVQTRRGEQKIGSEPDHGLQLSKLLCAMRKFHDAPTR